MFSPSFTGMIIIIRCFFYCFLLYFLMDRVLYRGGTPSGAGIVTYGAPTLPGAMLCLGYFEDGTPIVGLPGCVMYAKATVFDLILPRIAAGVRIDRKAIIRMGHGGLCLGCRECHYPVCPFGKET